MDRRRELRGEPLLPGTAAGRLLVLTAPLSFWGGVETTSGRIVAAGHPQRGLAVTGRLLALPASIGSSSSSSVLLELIRGGRAPAALLLAEVDAILLLGAVVARELGLTAPPALRLPAAALAALPDGAEARLEARLEKGLENGGRLRISVPGEKTQEGRQGSASSRTAR